MEHIREARALLWSGLCQLVTGIQTVSKVVAAIMVIATFVVLALHFLHVEVNPAIPDVWPIFEPSGILSMSDAWWHVRA